MVKITQVVNIFIISIFVPSFNQSWIKAIQFLFSTMLSSSSFDFSQKTDALHLPCTNVQYPTITSKIFNPKIDALHLPYIQYQRNISTEFALLFDCSHKIWVMEKNTPDYAIPQKQLPNINMEIMPKTQKKTNSKQSRRILSQNYSPPSPSSSNT